MGNVAGAKWIPWKKERWAIVKHFRNERDKLAQEAVFKEDVERLRWYDRMLNFVGNLDYHLKSNACPLCHSKNLVHGYVDSVEFEGIEDKDMGQIENVDLIRCLSCGFITLKEN